MKWYSNIADYSLPLHYNKCLIPYSKYNKIISLELYFANVVNRYHSVKRGSITNCVSHVASCLSKGSPIFKPDRYTKLLRLNSLKNLQPSKTCITKKVNFLK